MLSSFQQPRHLFYFHQGLDGLVCPAGQATIFVTNTPAIQVSERKTTSRTTNLHTTSTYYEWRGTACTGTGKRGGYLHIRYPRRRKSCLPGGIAGLNNQTCPDQT